MENIDYEPLFCTTRNLAELDCSVFVNQKQPLLNSMTQTQICFPGMGELHSFRASSVCFSKPAEELER